MNQLYLAFAVYFMILYSLAPTGAVCSDKDLAVKFAFHFGDSDPAIKPKNRR